MQRDTLVIQGREYNPTEERWRLIDEARSHFDESFAAIAATRTPGASGLGGGEDPYHEIGSVYFNRVCEIMGTELVI